MQTLVWTGELVPGVSRLGEFRDYLPQQMCSEHPSPPHTDMSPEEAVGWAEYIYGQCVMFDGWDTHLEHSLAPIKMKQMEKEIGL